MEQSLVLNYGTATIDPPTIYPLCNYTGVNCRGVNCRGSIFGGSIVGGQLSGGQLSGVNCRGVNCRGVNCRGVNCRGVNCRGVNCRGVDCRSVNCRPPLNYILSVIDSSITVQMWILWLKRPPKLNIIANLSVRDIFASNVARVLSQSVHRISQLTRLHLVRDATFQVGSTKFLDIYSLLIGMSIGHGLVAHPPGNF